MINVEIKNCNNIYTANIDIQKNKLNIRYAMNGTGKSTIGKAIKIKADKDDMDSLEPFDIADDEEPICNISPEIDRVFLFNDDFVNNIVFQESEVITNAFEVFIVTPEYEKRQAAISKKLNSINVDVNDNEDVKHILSVGNYVLSKFSENNSGGLKKIGMLKTLTTSENIFVLPKKLNRFKPLMEKKYTADWVGWKNEGGQYDDNNICPFCTDSLKEEYQSEKQLFNDSYTKSNVKNIKELLSYFDEVKDYMEESKKEKLYQCIKETKDVKEIELWIHKFYHELKLLVGKVNAIIKFNAYEVKREDISNLDKKLKSLLIDITDFDIFNNVKVGELIDFINSKVNLILPEIDLLKKDMGELKGLIGSAEKEAVKDINEFLEMAGINYEFEIRGKAENTSKSILKYVSKTQGSIEVDDINLHLSWGEKNAFALVLFMHYALSQNPDLVILDDPISSFDSNKKYAIINRLFSSDKVKSFYKNTVLMLTHDLQPVIDFVVN